MRIQVTDPSLILLIGPSGSGKSTFAKKHFKPTEVLSSDFCRALVSDDENNLSATKEAFEVLNFIASKRLATGKLIVVDATNVQLEARRPLIELARTYHVFATAIVFDLPARTCLAWNDHRTDRTVRPGVIRTQIRQMRESLRRLRREGFRNVYVLSSVADIDASNLDRRRLWVDRKDDHGPFDIIGDVHGCSKELVELLGKLGYEVRIGPSSNEPVSVKVPEGRKAIFIGDLVDRGPDIPMVLRIVMSMVASGSALCIAGNHDVRLARKLRGSDSHMTHGLAESLKQLEPEGDDFRQKVSEFLDQLVSHYALDDGKLVVAHAGLLEEYQGRASKQVRDFALYGETTGETDEFGLPVRWKWAEKYRGKATVVYGHTPVLKPEWANNTVNIDTGCVFGGRLTALRYPEMELVSVPAARTYYEPAKPLDFSTSPQNAEISPRSSEDLLGINDVMGKRIISTKLLGNVTIREVNANAALEVISRFSVDPRWLVYLPPTMSPPETTKEAGFLEHPREVFDYYLKQGVHEIVCEEKHMGSRAILIVCKNDDVARKRFGSTDGGIGTCYTRTGRPFFENEELQNEMLSRVHGGLDSAGLWDELKTDWIIFDTEILPWSYKAIELLKGQYAAVGSAARASLEETVASLRTAVKRSSEVAPLVRRYEDRFEAVSRYVDAYGKYCWPVTSLQDLKVAPFHILASEGTAHVDKDHLWHLKASEKLNNVDPQIFAATDFRVVNLHDSDSVAQAIRWWEEVTSRGVEGMVSKPIEFISRGKHGLVQPAMKCRGREYLRIIYGAEYALPENLQRLRSRHLLVKRSLALREFALGVEALERFVRNEPFYRLHECVFGVLAMESEPVDPRL